MGDIPKDMPSSFGLNYIAATLNVPEPALRLLVTIALGYPVALFHRFILFGKPPPVQHVYFALCGFLLGMYNFGTDMCHTLVTVLFVYLLLKTIGGTVHSVIITLVFTMSYLIIGYFKTATDEYDIVWTMPFCILVLRLSGLAFDIYDGSLPEERLSRDSKKLCLREVPSLLEVAAFAYFPTAFLIGPQFPMRKYKDFVSGKLKPAYQEFPQCMGPAIETLVLAIIYILLYTVGSAYYSDDYILSQDFEKLSWFNKVFDLGIWAHIALYKYIGSWKLTEGACTMIGLSYNGEDEKDKPKWDGCSNVDTLLFEKAQNFSHDYIASFNTNTNFWVFQYIYKRLAFLGNKLLSQLGVLLFLSIWHGLHSGYYVTFLMEFFAVYMEKEYFEILDKNKTFLNFLNQPLVTPFKWFFLKMYTIIFMGPCMAPLALLKYEKWGHVYKQIYCFHMLWMAWPLFRPVVKKILPPQRDPPTEQ